MPSSLSLVRRRATWLSRCAAIALLLLVVTPFTAPFSTYALVDIADVTDHGDLLSAQKTIEDANVVPILSDLWGPSVNSAVAHDSTPADTLVLRLVPRFVLRL